MAVYSWAAFLLAVACLTIFNKLAKALAALSCRSKIALVLTSSAVIVFLLASVLWACSLETKVGAKLGATFALPLVGKLIVG